MKRYTVQLSKREIDLLESALDSHEYWQLSDDTYRNSGYVLGDGSEDDENVKEIRRCRKLASRLHSVVTP